MRKVLALVMCFSLFAIQVWAQTRTITGKVTDDKGTPIADASVRAIGANVGVVTKNDGSFSISVSEKTTKLSISFTGFSTEEISINKNKNDYAISLKAQSSQIEEVVVTGYTQISRKKAPTAYAQVNSEKIQNVAMTNINEILQGQAPGLTINTISGQPGSSQNVRVRGIGSFSGGSPLYVIDGIPIERGQLATGSGGQQNSDILSSLNPNDVESVVVLKDASALALYGSRAGNGAVVITTKQGKAGGSKITFRVQNGITNPSFGNWQMMTPTEVYDYETNVARINGQTPAQIAAGWPNRDSLIANAFDWPNAGFRQGRTENYEISSQGGNDKTKHYMSMGYFKQQGTLIRSEFERYTIQSNITNQASKRLSLTMNLNLTYSNTLNGDAGNRFTSPLLGSFTNNPLFTKPYDPQGNLYTGRETPAGFAITRDNFLYSAAVNFNRNKQLRTFGKFSATYKVAEWMKFTQDLAIDMVNIREKAFWDPTSSDGFNNRGEVRDNNLTALTATNRSNLTGVIKLNADNVIDYYAGLEYINYNQENSFAQGIGLSNGLLRVLNVTATPQGVAGGATAYSFLGYIGQVNYTLKNKYYLSGSIRRDGSSRFGANTRFANFWSAAGSWQISEEKFLKKVRWVNDLKLRASYGTSGSAEFGDFVSQQTYAFTVAYNGIPGSAPSTIGNPNLTWEKISSLNVGLDFALFNNKVTGNFNAYRRVTSQALQNVPISSTAGFTTAQLNVGKLENTGVELLITTTNVDTKDFTWKTDLNGAINRNKILTLFNDQDIIGGNLSIRRVGQPIDAWFLREWAGVNPANGNPLWRYQGGVTNQWNPADRNVQGTPYPVFTGGITNTFSYRNFNVSFFFFGSLGNKIYNQTMSFADADGQRFGWNYNRAAGNSYWQKPGDIAQRPRPVIGGNLLSANASTRYLEDGSYVRLRNITFSYDLPKNVLNKFKMQALRFYVQGQNLITWTKYTGVDPEVGIDGNEFFKYPVPKVITVGLDVTF